MPPTIVWDSVEVGHLLIGPNGQWSGSGLTYTRAWTRDGANIAGATGAFEITGCALRSSLAA
jgi:hypothetical protein